jgi:hypothetical protein
VAFGAPVGKLLFIIIVQEQKKLLMLNCDTVSWPRVFPQPHTAEHYAYNYPVAGRSKKVRVRPLCSLDIICFNEFQFSVRLVSEDFAIIEISDEFTDWHYRDIFKLVPLSAAIDANHSINCYSIIYGEASHRVFP